MVKAGQFTNGNTAAATHGAYSVRLTAARARAHRRRFLRHAGLRASDLDAIARAYLEQWAHGRARMDAFDSGERESKNYWTAFNSTHRALKSLEARMRELGLAQGRAVVQPGAKLERYLDNAYGTGVGSY